MNKENILGMFFNEILPSIAKGNLKIEDANCNIHFNIAIQTDNGLKYISNIHNQNSPTMIIKNIESFSNILLSYLDKVLFSNISWSKPYFDVSSKRMRIKYILSFMWTNMTLTDFLDPECYIKRYIAFLDDKTFADLSFTTPPINILNGCCLKISNNEEKPCFETPYFIRVKIVDKLNDYEFLLPDIKYGIEEVNGIKTAYVYAIQYGKDLQLTAEEMKLKSQINRILYKVDQDISKEELSKKTGTLHDNNYEENIVDVSPAALVSLTAFLSLLVREKINKVIVPTYLPVRWDAKSTAHKQKLKIYRNRYKYSKEAIVNMKQELEQDQLHIQHNITDKLIRNFNRIKYHFKGLDIEALPFDIDESLHLFISDQFQANNPAHLLSSISEATINYEPPIRTR